MKNPNTIKRIAAVILSLLILLYYPISTKTEAEKTGKEIAQEIEEEYGIEIYLLEECSDIPIPEPYEYYNKPAYRLEDIISKADPTTRPMQIIQRELRRYPPEMFSQFKNRGGNLRLICTGIIKNTAEPDYPLGVTTFDGQNYNLFISLWVIYGEALEHELWHTFENLIMNEYPETISEEDWSALNPPGFTYHMDYNNFRDYEADPAIILPSENAYFAWSYSTLNPQEDRATIYELQFDPEHTEEWWEQHPYLNTKRKKMEQWLSLLSPILENIVLFVP